MIGNRERGLDDYLAIGRRHLKVIVPPALVGIALGYAISFAMTPRYTSRSLLQVEAQVVPAGYIKPIVTERVSDRMMTLEQTVLSRDRLRPLVRNLDLVRAGESEDMAIGEIRRNLSVTEADPSSGFGNRSTSEGGPGGTADVPGFFVSFTSDNPTNAQRVCGAITTMLLDGNLKLREQVAESTTEILSSRLDQAKRNLDSLDNKLSEFEKAHMGRLPGDAENNLQVLSGLESQVEGNTQAISRAQQDKSYAESLLAQELAAWKSGLAAPALPSLQQQLISLQNNLLAMQIRDTENHPDVVRTKREIAEVEDKLKKMNADTEETPAAGSLKKLEPGEIRGLRHQIYQLDENIERTTTEQKQLKERIAAYQSRLAISPELDQQWKLLTRDNATAHGIYDGLLANKNSAEMQTEMERKQQGEQLKLLDPANLPANPSFPIRSVFATYGLIAGLGLGLAVALWLEVQDKSMRDEADVIAALELPVLGAMPSVEVAKRDKESKNKFRLTPFFDGE
jgi:uncharacterized protein involved in exopolysaccharide biosynthesis